MYQWEMLKILKNLQQIRETPCSIEINWNISAEQGHSLTFNALFLQRFSQHQR